MNKIFYHSVDLDGQGSAAVARDYFTTIKKEDTDLIGINYGYNFEDKVLSNINYGDNIYILDFSFQPSEIITLQKKECDITWIDHHKTAIEDVIKSGVKLKGNSEISDKAACRLTWDYFYKDKPVPLTINLLSWYDTWNHHMEDRVLPFQYGLRIYDTRPENIFLWNQILQSKDEFVDNIVKQGDTILQYIDKDNEIYANSYAYVIYFEGLYVLVCNRGRTGSKLFDSIFDPDKHDAMITFCYRDGWNFSMYSSKDNVDCSKVARKYGGGGHKSACGWRMSELPKEFFNPLDWR